MQYQFTDRISSGAPAGDSSENIYESLIGRRVMIRWPADNNFYEAVITEYNPVDVCSFDFLLFCFLFFVFHF